MSQTVRLTMVTGPHKGQRYCFRGPTACVVGRSPECFARLVGHPQDDCVSRRHCQLLLDPPVMRAQDLGSANGTYINGHKLDANAAANDLQVVFHDGPPIASLRDGDVITLGGMSLKVDVVDCPPHTPEAQAAAPLWQACETAKKDCPIACR